MVIGKKKKEEGKEIGRKKNSNRSLLLLNKHVAIQSKKV